MVLLLTAGVCLSSGCARQYVIKSSSGSRIVTSGKPRLKNGTYYYKDISGNETSMPAGRVVEVSPASMAHDDKPIFKPSTK